MSTSDRRVEVHPDREAIVRFDPDRTFHCVDHCTWCCHQGVMLYEDDLFRLAEVASLRDTTTEHAGRPFVDTESKDRAQHVGPDGIACTFLDDDGKCRLHADHAWKPTRCSVFPLDISLEDGEIVVDIRNDAERNCEGMDVGERRLIDHLDAFLPPLLWDLSDPSTAIEL